MKEVLKKYFTEVYMGLGTDLFHSEAEIISILTLFLFCFCCYQLIKSIYTPIPVMAHQRRYARAACQVEKAYKIFSWGIMTAAFLLGLVMAFYQIFTAI